MGSLIAAGDVVGVRTCWRLAHPRNGGDPAAILSRLDLCDGVGRRSHGPDHAPRPDQSPRLLILGIDCAEQRACRRLRMAPPAIGERVQCQARATPSGPISPPERSLHRKPAGGRQLAHSGDGFGSISPSSHAVRQWPLFAPSGHRGSRGRAVTFGGRLNRLWTKARL